MSPVHHDCRITVKRQGKSLERQRSADRSRAAAKSLSGRQNEQAGTTLPRALYKVNSFALNAKGDIGLDRRDWQSRPLKAPVVAVRCDAPRSSSRSPIRAAFAVSRCVGPMVILRSNPAQMVELQPGV